MSKKEMNINELSFEECMSEVESSRRISNQGDYL